MQVRGFVWVSTNGWCGKRAVCHTKAVCRSVVAKNCPSPEACKYIAPCSGELYSTSAPVAAQRQRHGTLTTSSPGADTLARPLAAAPVAKS